MSDRITPLENTELAVAANGDHPNHHDWTEIPMNDPSLAIPPEPPAIQGLLYTGKRHVISGPPESNKTLVAYALLLEAARAGHKIGIIDFEMGPNAARRLLDDLGATQDELANLYFVSPDSPPQPQHIERASQRCDYLVIDASVGAYGASGLDDNSRKDAETFARMWLQPFWQTGVSTIVIDHVTKDADNRGKYAIGSERKTGQADVHLSLTAIKQLSRGTQGSVKVTVHKDRPGFLPRPTATVIELTSDPDTHQISWTFRDPHPTDEVTGQFRPTVLMSHVSRFLEQQHEPVTRNTIKNSVKGKTDALITAIDVLVAEGYATEEQGPNRARLVSFVKAFYDTSEQVVPGSSQVVPGTREPPDRSGGSQLVPPFRGELLETPGRSGPGNHSGSSHWQDELIDDREAQRLLDTYGIGA